MKVSPNATKLQALVKLLSALLYKLTGVTAQRQGSTVPLPRQGDLQRVTVGEKKSAKKVNSKIWIPLLIWSYLTCLEDCPFLVLFGKKFKVRKTTSLQKAPTKSEDTPVLLVQGHCWQRCRICLVPMTWSIVWDSEPGACDTLRACHSATLPYEISLEDANNLA